MPIQRPLRRRTVGDDGTSLYRDRRDAGRRLAACAERLRHDAPVVLAVPRGGVPVGAEVARALSAPLDVIVVHKVGQPGRRVGAVAEGGIAAIDHDRARELGVSATELSELRVRAWAAADVDAGRHRHGAAPRDVVGRTVLIVDDGAATGASALAAARTARHRGAARVVVVLPVASPAALARFGEDVDEVICVEVAPLVQWYDEAPPVTDAEIQSALQDPGRPLDPYLYVPEGARGAIVRATGSEVVRARFHAIGFATLEATAGDVDDIVSAADRLRGFPATEHLRLGLFGLGRTADAVLAAGAGAHAIVAAGASHRAPTDSLAELVAPTMVIVGGEDRAGVRAARSIGERLGARVRYVAVVAGASRDFAEPGALEQVAHLAGSWFARHLSAP